VRDEQTGWNEADITINGTALSFVESMAVRVAIGSFRMFCNDPTNRKQLGAALAEGYDRHLQAVEQRIIEGARWQQK
jgi:hypothetical protein